MERYFGAEMWTNASPKVMLGQRKYGVQWVGRGWRDMHCTPEWIQLHLPSDRQYAEYFVICSSQLPHYTRIQEKTYTYL